MCVSLSVSFITCLTHSRFLSLILSLLLLTLPFPFIPSLILFLFHLFPPLPHSFILSLALHIHPLFNCSYYFHAEVYVWYVGILKRNKKFCKWTNEDNLFMLFSVCQARVWLSLTCFLSSSLLLHLAVWICWSVCSGHSPPPPPPYHLPFEKVSCVYLCLK